jgi:hypothetical protein
MNNNRRNKKIVKNFKDYLIPIIWVIIVFIVILNFIFWGNNDKSKETIVNNVPLELIYSDQNTESYIVYASGDKKKVTQNTELYKWEKLQIWTTWDITLKIPNEWWTLVLNRLWELKYNEDASYTLLSSDLWLNTKNKTQIEMRYAKISSTPESVFNLSQNEVASSIYVVYGNVEVTNTAWTKTTLQKWQKLSIMRNESNDKNLDLSLKKEEIDDYTKNDDWFIKNNWSFYLNKVEESNTSSWITQTWSINSMSWTTTWNISSGFEYISFNNQDESDVTTDTVNIEGKILDDIVYKVEIDWKTATINQEDKTFSLKNLKLSSRINNIVYRVFDESNKLMSKWVLTLYYANGWTPNAWSSNSSPSLAWVENYSLNNSPLYKIISPKQNPYTTSEKLVMIEWTVPARTVQKIIINWFQLQQFPANWTYWKYFANEDFWNLKDWLNIYKIQYFGADEKLIFENTYTIIKEPAKTTNNTENNTSTQTTSWTTNETSNSW